MVSTRKFKDVFFSIFYRFQLRQLNLWTQRLLLVILIGLVIRLIIAPITIGEETIYWSYHIEFIRAGFIFNFYSVAYYSPSLAAGYEYGPVWFLILLPISLVRPDLYSPSWRLLVKSPVIIADLINGILIYKLSGHNKQGFLAASLWLLNPYSIYISSAFASFDSFCGMFLLLFLFFIVRRKFSYAGVSYALALMSKQYTYVTIPLVLIALFKRYNSKQVATCLASTLCATAAMFLPFAYYSPAEVVNVLLVKTRGTPIFNWLIKRGEAGLWFILWKHRIFRMVGLRTPNIATMVLYGKYLVIIGIGFFALLYLLSKINDSEINMFADALLVSACIFCLFGALIDQQYLIFPLLLACLRMKWSTLISLPALTSSAAIHSVREFWDLMVIKWMKIPVDYMLDILGGTFFSNLLAFSLVTWFVYILGSKLYLISGLASRFSFRSRA